MHLNYFFVDSLDGGRAKEFLDSVSNEVRHGVRRTSFTSLMFLGGKMFTRANRATEESLLLEAFAG